LSNSSTRRPPTLDLESLGVADDEGRALLSTHWDVGDGRDGDSH
jgi:hypothetical protein